jgi:hypothetical protein
MIPSTPNKLQDRGVRLSTRTPLLLLLLLPPPPPLLVRPPAPLLLLLPVW